MSRRGVRLEPLARDLYTKLTGIPVKVVCVVHDDLVWCRASLDGWCEDPKIVLEIKSPNWRDHETALSGEIPEKYIPQIQHQLAITGGTCHYVSYTDNPRFSGKDELALVEISPDSKKIEEILMAEKSFWAEVVKLSLNPIWQTG